MIVGDKKKLFKNFFPITLYLANAYAAGTPTSKASRVANKAISPLNANELIKLSDSNTLTNHCNENPCIGKVIVLSEPNAVTAIMIRGINKNANTKIEITINPLCLRIRLHLAYPISLQSHLMLS